MFLVYPSTRKPFYPSTLPRILQSIEQDRQKNKVLFTGFSGLYFDGPMLIC